jgi:hypothetical protein
VLVEMGGDVDARVYTNRSTPLQGAVELGRTETVKVSHQPWVQAGLEQEGQQQQNKREQEVHRDGSAGFKQNSSRMSAGMGHVWGFASAPLGEVVRRCLRLAIFRTRQYLLGSSILLL